MMMEGWICPRCKRVNAPWVSHCSCFDFQDNQNTYNMAVDTSLTHDKEK